LHAAISFFVLVASRKNNVAWCGNVRAGARIYPIADKAESKYDLGFHSRARPIKELDETLNNEILRNRSLTARRALRVRVEMQQPHSEVLSGIVKQGALTEVPGGIKDDRITRIEREYSRARVVAPGSQNIPRSEGEGLHNAWICCRDQLNPTFDRCLTFESLVVHVLHDEENMKLVLTGSETVEWIEAHLEYVPRSTICRQRFLAGAQKSGLRRTWNMFPGARYAGNDSLQVLRRKALAVTIMVAVMLERREYIEHRRAKIRT